ncbi:MAG: hypothetical protein ACRDHF_09240 [Tepidiformaceae bacterium]
MLVSYFDPRSYVALGDLESPPFGSPIGSLGHFEAIDGAEPLGPSTRDTILSLMRELSRSDPDPRIKDAARFVNEGLEAILRVESGG